MMHETNRWTVCAALACCLTYASAASAQTAVRVTVDRATIYTADFQSAAAVVDAGTILTVVGERADWYEVTLPAFGGVAIRHGFIYKKLVVDAKLSRPGAPYRDRRAAGLYPSGRSHFIGGAGYGQFSFARFAAHNSFDAVLGSSAGAFFGGGGELRIGRGPFIGGSVEHFSKAGQRVAVAGGEVFGLGIPDTVTLTPVQVTAGWRFEHERLIPYGGGGVGSVFYREASNFADPGENVSGRFASYHVLGGIEVRDGWVATAFEVEYSRVPNAVGVGGVSAAFQESNLGGVAARIKVVVGR